MDTHLAKVELVMGEMRDKFEDTNKSIEGLSFIREELRGEMQGAFNETMDVFT